jgi:hypothetical protein
LSTAERREQEEGSEMAHRQKSSHTTGNSSCGEAQSV